MTPRIARVYAPPQHVGHHFVLHGWMTGVDSPNDVTVLIGRVPAALRPTTLPDTPEGAVSWLAEPNRPVPKGNHSVTVADPDGTVLTNTSVTVRQGADDEPMWLGALDVPQEDMTVSGDVVFVTGWALLDGRAPSVVEAVVEGGDAVRARTRLPRPDVGGALSGFPDAAVSGYEARVPLDVPPGTEREVRVSVRCRTATVGERTSPPRSLVLRKPPYDRADAAMGTELHAHTRRTLAGVSSQSDPAHLLVFTHSLAIGGGQLWLYELLHRLIRNHRWQVTLVTERDGPLRADCEALGIPIHLTTHYRSSTIADYEGHVAELAAVAKCSGASVALVNTLGGFPAADAAERAGLATAWVIHESFTLTDFAYQNWGPDKPPTAVWDRWEHTLANADRLLFVADATRELFLPYSTPERCRTVRYGTPMVRFGGHTHRETRQQARRLLGIDDDTVSLVNIGIVEPRKGNGPLIAAMKRIQQQYPNVRLSIVGNNDSPYCLALADVIKQDGLDDYVDLVPVQRDPTPWLQAADVFVNASDIESLPRSILEAVCCGVPVVATDVFGAREMIKDGESGWLCEPNDVDSLTTGILRALDTPVQQRQHVADAAYDGLRDWLDPADYAETYSAILSSLSRSDEPRHFQGGEP